MSKRFHANMTYEVYMPLRPTRYIKYIQINIFVLHCAEKNIVLHGTFHTFAFHLSITSNHFYVFKFWTCLCLCTLWLFPVTLALPLWKTYKWYTCAQVREIQSWTCNFHSRHASLAQFLKYCQPVRPEISLQSRSSPLPFLIRRPDPLIWLMVFPSYYTTTILCLISFMRITAAPHVVKKFQVLSSIVTSCISYIR